MLPQHEMPTLDPDGITTLGNDAVVLTGGGREGTSQSASPWIDEHRPPPRLEHRSGAAAGPLSRKLRV